jgi:hypothetical protein
MSSCAALRICTSCTSLYFMARRWFLWIVSPNILISLKKCCLGIYFLFGVAVPNALDAHTWSKSLGLENYLSKKMCSLHFLSAHTVCWPQWTLFSTTTGCEPWYTSNLHSESLLASRNWNVFMLYLCGFSFIYTWKYIWPQKAHIASSIIDILPAYIHFEISD